jgi:hypothetical protein
LKSFGTIKLGSEAAQYFSSSCLARWYTLNRCSVAPPVQASGQWQQQPLGCQLATLPRPALPSLLGVPTRTPVANVLSLRRLESRRTYITWSYHCCGLRQRRRAADVAGDRWQPADTPTSTVGCKRRSITQHKLECVPRASQSNGWMEGWQAAGGLTSRAHTATLP